ncbi:MAG TPA: S-layer family protein, partial [Crinalium sp.]
NKGTGNAGILQVNANFISLDRDGSITAATASGEGGNLDLNVRDVLLLRNNSQITTSAGGNGGNIRINAGTIVAVPAENSDIRANSVNARGGNITINTSGVFGIQFRPQDTPLSDITATGASSALSGAVQLNINQLDPTASLVALPTTIVDSSALIAQGCPATQGNAFVISGRGGLPPTPEQRLDDDADWQDRRRLTVAQRAEQRRGSNQQLAAGSEQLAVSRDAERSSNAARLKTQNPKLKAFPGTSIVEATEWHITSTGAIALVATTPEPTVQHRLYQPVACQGR